MPCLRHNGQRLSSGQAIHAANGSTDSILSAQSISPSGYLSDAANNLISSDDSSDALGGAEPPAASFAAETTSSKLEAESGGTQSGGGDVKLGGGRCVTLQGNSTSPANFNRYQDRGRIGSGLRVGYANDSSGS